MVGCFRGETGWCSGGGGVVVVVVGGGGLKVG